MNFEDREKIKDILKARDYDLACQLWVGAHGRTGNLYELASIIYDGRYYDVNNSYSSDYFTIQLNDKLKIVMFYNRFVFDENRITGIRIYNNKVVVFEYHNSNRKSFNSEHDAWRIAILVCLTYIAYDKITYFNLPNNEHIRNIIMEGLPNKLSFYDQPIMK